VFSGLRNGKTRFWKGEVGAPVFIVVRCIAATGRLGQPMKSIHPFIKGLRNLSVDLLVGLSYRAHLGNV
jgi:hypothetical protein